MCSLLSRRSCYIVRATTISPTRRLHSPESRRFFAEPPLLRRRATWRFPVAVTGAPRRYDSPRPATDSRSPEIEDFVRIGSSRAEDLSESVVRADEPWERDAVSAGAAAEASEPEPDPERRRVVLPDELSRSVVVLECESSAEGGVCYVYLVGTVHVSEESCREVEAVIKYLKPEVVFLELCLNREKVLLRKNLQVPTTGEMVEMWKRSHNLFGTLCNWYRAKALWKVGSKVKVVPGSEFRVAFEEAMKYGGKVMLGDRPMQITLQRLSEKMPVWHKIKLLYYQLFPPVYLQSPEEQNKMVNSLHSITKTGLFSPYTFQLKEMDDVDMLTLAIQQLSKEFPTLVETLVHERDKYMSSMLLQIASESSSVVAVVGEGHLQGIKNHWKQPVVIRDLMEVRSQKPADYSSRIFRSLGFAAAGAAIISSIYLFR